MSVKYIEMTDEDTAIVERIAIGRWSTDRRMHKALVRHSRDSDCIDSVKMSLLSRNLLAR